MTKKEILGPILVRLTQTWAPKVSFVDFVSTSSQTVLSYPIQFKGKHMNQTWENGKKPNFGHIFDPNLPPPQFFLCGFYLC